MTRPHRLSAACTACAALLCAGAASAAELGAFYELGPRPEATRWSAGAALLAGGRFEGSDRQRAMAVPSVSWQSPSGWFAEPVNGLGFNFSNRRDLQYGLRLTLETGRDTQAELPGFEKIDWRANAGLFANWRAAERLELKSALRAGMADGGVALHLGASYELWRRGGASVGLNGSVRLVNADYNRAYFGVTPAQAARSGLRSFNPGGGLNASQVSLSARAPLGDRWFGYASLGWKQLHGDAADSPVSRKDGQPQMLIGAGYRF